MRDDLKKLRDLMIKIISEYDIDEININLGHGNLEINSESDYCYYYLAGNAEEMKTRIGIDTMITIAKDNFKITDNLNNLINKLEGDK